MSLWERVNNIEFNNFLTPNPEYDPEYFSGYQKAQSRIQKIYIVIFILYNIIGLISLASFFYLRNWYIIKQRNFWLTFINGIFAFLSGFVTLLAQITPTPCGYSLYTSNVINPFYNAIFFSRSLRIVLFYRFNIFKVTELKRKNKLRMRESYLGEKEPNNYLPKIYKKINRIVYFVIAVPTIITLVITIIRHNLSEATCSFSFSERKYATDELKDAKVGSLFSLAPIFGSVMAIAMFIMLLFLSKIKDNSKYGVKFECISTIILIVIITVLNGILNSVINRARERHYGKNMEFTVKHQLAADQSFYPLRFFLRIYDYTKGGRVLYCIISTYMIFVSIMLPCIKCLNSKMEKNKYFHEPTSSIQYFYKVLNSPPLLEELKSIAIKEFSVENVLFWENYQILQKMVYRYQIEYKKAERIGNPRLVSQYDFEGYYQQQLQNFSVSSMDDYSYDPNMPVPREIMPYYINFYHTFIDTLSPASVNISGASIKHIYAELSNYPTVGMYDNAKNEIVEMMYSSIFPILLRKNRKQLHNTSMPY